jgi:hypothetical protein
MGELDIPDTSASEVARLAQIAILKELLSLDRYDYHTKDDVESWATHRLWELGDR